MVCKRQQSIAEFLVIMGQQQVNPHVSRVCFQLLFLIGFHFWLFCVACHEDKSVAQVVDGVLFRPSTGSKFKLNTPYGDELPQRGFDAGENTYQAPPEDGSALKVNIDPSSQRLQVFSWFLAFAGV
jgi:hypothetical protein